MKHDYILEQITDYVLDLLSEAEKEAVDNHIAACKNCRLVLQQEQQMFRLIRSTLQSSPQPAPQRLRQLRPEIPFRPRSAGKFPVWQKRLAPVFMALLLLLGSLGLQLALPVDQAKVFGSTVHAAATALATKTPENATLISGSNAVMVIETNDGTETAVATQPAIDVTTNTPVAAPAPIPTPGVKVLRLITH